MRIRKNLLIGCQNRKIVQSCCCGDDSHFCSISQLSSGIIGAVKSDLIRTLPWPHPSWVRFFFILGDSHGTSRAMGIFRLQIWIACPFSTIFRNLLKLFFNSAIFVSIMVIYYANYIAISTTDTDKKSILEKKFVTKSWLCLRYGQTARYRQAGKT